jgi:multidrug efflux pump subunit AcrA (membrane-fusion protein)
MDTVAHGAASAPSDRGFLSGAGRIALTVAFFGAAIAAGTVGYGILAARSVASTGPDPAPLTTVATERLEILDDLVVTRRFTGQFEAAQEAALGFEEGGTIAEVLVREGEAVTQGAVIARLDTRLLEAEHARLSASRRALAAQVELARRTDARQQTLLAEGHVTQQRVDETSLRLAELEAALAEVDAGLAAVDVRLSKAVLRAPFDGRIGARLLDQGAVAGPGSAVVTLLEEAPARFRVAIDPDLADRDPARNGVLHHHWPETREPSSAVPQPSLSPELDRRDARPCRAYLRPRSMGSATCRRRAPRARFN